MNIKLTGMLGAAAVVLASAFAAQAQTTLKWAHVYETSEPFHTETVWAAEEIAKRTDGRYKIEVYPASQLGKEADINQGLKLGTVDIIVSGSSYAARDYKPIGVTYFPYAFRDADHLLAYAQSDVFKRLAQGYEDATGNHIAAVTYYGTRHTSSNKEIKACADMQGLKIRVPDVPAYLAMPRACGANTTPIAFAEVYLALQNGTVDAQENPLTTIEAKKFYEVQKYITISRTILGSQWVTVNDKWYSSLPAEDRKIFDDAFHYGDVAARGQSQIIQATGMKFLEEKKMTVTTITDQNYREFQKIGRTAVLDWCKTKMDPEIVDRFLKTVDEIEKSVQGTK